MIGKTIYIFNANNRVYEKDAKGRSQGAPIYRKHWEPIQVIGETKNSWLVGYEHNPTKISKKDLREGKLHNICLTEKEVDDKVFLHDHAYRIGEAVGKSQDVALLKNIADMVLYEAKK